MSTDRTAAWRGYRVGKPGSPIPSEPCPYGDDIAGAIDWDDRPGLLVVVGDSYTERRGVGFTAVGSVVDDPLWKGYWTAYDYVRNLDQLENAFKLARVTNGNDDVLAEAYAYEVEIHVRESEDVLFLDQLSECSLNARRAFDLFNLISTRAASTHFRTVVSVSSLTAAVSNHDASRAFHALFDDSSLTSVISI